MSKGYVYILSNEAMPGLLKIGKTTRDVNGRANELYQTGVPTPFKVEYSVLSPDCDELEIRMHGHLPDKRVSPGREFFNIDCATAVGLLDDLLMEQVEDWVDEFIPDQRIVDPDMTVDVADLSMAVIDEVNRFKLAPPEIAGVIHCISAEEFASAALRYIERRDRLAEDRRTAALKVVGDE